MNLPRASRSASVFSFRKLFRYLQRAEYFNHAFSLGRFVLIGSLFFFLSTTAAAADYVTLSGRVRIDVGGTAPNLTFFWERNDAGGWTVIPATTDEAGNYSVTLPNCHEYGGTWYYPRFILPGGGVTARGYNYPGNPFYWNRCGNLPPHDLLISSDIQSAQSRYNAGPTSCPIQSVGRPVNVTNGNMWLQQMDYILPGSVGGINISRTYNSGIDVSGIFGNGWSSDYETRLITVPSSTNEFLIQLDAGTGLVVDFFNSGGSVYQSSRSGLEGSIVPDGSDYLLTWKDGRSFRFSQTGLLLSKKDRNGNQTSFTYTSNNLTGITDPFGRSISITPTSNGKVSQIADSMGTIATYAYDASGEYLTSVTYADGSKYKFEYVTVGTKTYLATVKDVLDNVLETHLYDSSGRAYTSELHGGVERYEIDYSHAQDQSPYTTVRHRKALDLPYIEAKYFFDASLGKNVIVKTEGLCGCGGSGSEITQYEYDSRLNLTKVTDALLDETTYTYDNAGNRLTQTDVFGIQRWTYNSLGQVLTYKDRIDQSTSNNTVTNTYDPPSGGNLLTTTDRLGYTTTLTYTTLGQIETVTDARNKTTTFGYDLQGRLENVTDANSKVTAFGYDDRARLTSVTNALSETTTFTYDLNNRPKKVIFPDTNYTENTYDLAGRRTHFRDERGKITIFGYDEAYRLTSVTDPLNHTRSFGYDLMSNLTSQTDALGNTTEFEYDDFNRLEKVIYPPATVGATRLEEMITYDKVGKVKTRVDTAGRTTSYDYDTPNRRITITDTDNKLTQFDYNLRLQLEKVKDALNQEYVFTYDPLGRKLSETRAGTTMSYVYDPVGNRTKRTDHNGTVTNYTYDNLNRLTSGSLGTYTYDDLSRMLTATNYHGTVSFTYDNRGRVDTTTDVYGKVLDYDYDENGNRKLLKLNGLSHTGYTYDDADRLETITNIPESAVTTYGYDFADRLISKALPNGVTTSYGYDDMSRLKRIKDEGTSVINDRNYAYNTANQIESITEPNRTRNFTYDNVDRLTGATDTLLGNESYSYDAVGNRLSSHLSSTYTHQPFNRLTATSSASYTYDNNGAMTSRTDSNGTLYFSHDSDGRLMSAYSFGGPWGFEMADYGYDALGRRISKSEPNDLPREYTYDGDNVLESSWGGSPTMYVNGPGIDNPLSMKLAGSSTWSYPLTDHLGTGGVTDSFGNGSQGFTGREYDSFTELQYSRARMYDPKLGRFTSEDPIGFNGGDLNLYGYVWNNPIHFTDPMGLDGFGNDFADWLDSNIEFARSHYMGDSSEWKRNGTVNTIADLAGGTADMFRVGSGLGYAIYAEDENAWGRAAFVAMDIARATGLATAMGYPGARFAASPTGQALNSRMVACFPGKEYTFGNVRIAPFGNRTGHPTGEKPHYHRQGPKHTKGKKKGQPLPGQGKRRHRPWDTTPDDKSFWDRF